MSNDLLLARQLPNGAFEWRENVDINRRLREGDATLGWTGDESLSLVMNLAWTDPADGVTKGRVEVWQRLSDTEQRILIWRRGTRVAGDELIRELVAHDTRYHDVGAEVLAHNAAVEKQRDDEFGEFVEDNADRLAWALGKDLGEPAQDGRPYRPGAAL
jgi:hypothetical protein